ncbi:MAG: hypothetical protein IKQ72_11805 [Bacteroidaceae bacterium]|nr:hypothetical protein [Bacteroidaceae bacterium]
MAILPLFIVPHLIWHINPRSIYHINPRSIWYIVPRMMLHILPRSIYTFNTWAGEIVARSVRK